MSLPLHVNFHEGGQVIVGHVEHQGAMGTDTSVPSHYRAGTALANELDAIFLSSHVGPSASTPQA